MSSVKRTAVGWLVGCQGVLAIAGAAVVAFLDSSALPGTAVGPLRLMVFVPLMALFFLGMGQLAARPRLREVERGSTVAAVLTAIAFVLDAWFAGGRTLFFSHFLAVAATAVTFFALMALLVTVRRVEVALLRHGIRRRFTALAGLLTAVGLLLVAFRVWVLAGPVSLDVGHLLACLLLPIAFAAMVAYVLALSSAERELARLCAGPETDLAGARVL